ncbi:hypothetical protein AKJ47_00590 [candidate division MSBL1 archaeon SCGC-AAA261G05]|nr:hypothetical protein AKJ47_00590 [candidate division MSBL1 archaeon SCGC-AAA261G05]
MKVKKLAISVERLPSQVSASCGATRKDGTPCASSARWAIGLDEDIELLACGTHGRYSWNRTEDINDLGDLEKRGFCLKKVEELAENRTIITASGLAGDEFGVSDKVALAEGGD